LRLRFCFIGGIAIQHWGEPRTTRDIDVSVFAGFGGEGPIIDQLLAAFPGRIADAREFAIRHRVLLIWVRDSAGVSVDAALAGLPFESEMIARAVRVSLDTGPPVQICTAEDLMVLKAFADRLQ